MLASAKMFARLTALALITSAPLSAQTTPTASGPLVATLANGPPQSAIFIGNSFFYYNNGIHSQVGALIRSVEPGSRFRGTMATISGSGIDWHDVGSYFRPNAVGRYSFRADNSIVFNKIDKLFDVAIIMDCSQCPIHPELKLVFHEHTRKHTETIRKHGAEPVLFMSWAYADKPDMTATLAAAYTQAGNDNKALVIPAGLAFARAIAQRPTLNLYAEDKRHPSPAGTYLAAATTYAMLFNKSPAGLPYKATLDAETATFLQSVAWDTVVAYRGP
jgi:hypothetical protein